MPRFALESREYVLYISIIQKLLNFFFQHTITTTVHLLLCISTGSTKWQKYESIRVHFLLDDDDDNVQLRKVV